MAAFDRFSKANRLSKTDDGSLKDGSLFELIADDLEKQGYSIRPAALPEAISGSLFHHQQCLNANKYIDAGIGRRDDYLKNDFVRTDEICWITGQSDSGQAWIDWTSQLQRYLNQRLFLGLFSFESHFAHYPPGAFYKRHYDAFRGEANRVLSVVTYLNPDWCNTDGGELVLYRDDTDQEGISVVPLYGTIVVFLSEEFPHEVRPATRDRYSIAGWFRVNTSINNRIDPPR
ncbi:2OG-Fe(II) oxygenase superfamily protein [Vibrio ruber DSM 16370]|uniref:2OG-Fe(II) oxygenase superfamily protein n=1 Tax=Vibrio ruber (strain DSM 16370 / JCM 11486 / BCRC 17186 / CECT 7878 / LMG 23124 / VR1) TaxID=1123498 RepID=A0A1R4LAT6_VIBR1|nr:2OG-Fe(II) oxygenase [Vibrio ruber]SJN53675.1 2OG-Fe(II) oxygenase superfamily protein [Vibrio ruber DSM 16370]